LTPEQILEGVYAEPEVHGVVRGVVGKPSARKLPNPDRPSAPLVVREFPFTVHEFIGKEASPYPIGATITLRTPGGVVGSVSMDVEDAPRIKPGTELFVFLVDKGPFEIARWGGDTPTTLVALEATDVFEVDKGVVHGHGTYASIAEPITTFEQRFKP
jgi:hypothetical protein